MTGYLALCLPNFLATTNLPAGPTMFLDALWLPYRRDRGKLEAALAAAAAAAAAGGGPRGQALRAVFAHTDIVSRGVDTRHRRCTAWRPLPAQPCFV